jgi:hypothetical protein
VHAGEIEQGCGGSPWGSWGFRIAVWWWVGAVSRQCSAVSSSCAGVDDRGVVVFDSGSGSAAANVGVDDS